MIVVTDKGKVEHKNITLDNVSTEDIKKTVELINNLIVGTPIDEVSTKLEFEIKPIISKYVEQHQQLYNAIYNVFTDITNTDINVVGRTKFLEQPEFDNVDKIRDLFKKLDDKEILQEIKKMTLIILKFISVVRINLMMMLLLLRLTLRLIVKKVHLLS